MPMSHWVQFQFIIQPSFDIIATAIDPQFSQFQGAPLIFLLY